MSRKSVVTCTKCGMGMYEHEEQKCSTCGEKNPYYKENKRLAKQSKELNKKLKNIILTTGFSIEGKKIKEYKGIVSAEVIIGMNIFRDWSAEIHDVFGGRAHGYEKALEKYREIVFTKLCKQACEKGANAIIGLQVNYQQMRGSMLMMTLNGTAVVVNANSSGV